MVEDLLQNYLYIFAVDFVFSFFFWGFIYLNISIVVVFFCVLCMMQIFYILFMVFDFVMRRFFFSHMSMIIRLVFSVSVKGEASYCNPEKSVLMCQTRCTLSLSNLHAIVLWFINIKRRTRINELLLNILSGRMILHRKYFLKKMAIWPS